MVLRNSFFLRVRYFPFTSLRIHCMAAEEGGYEIGVNRQTQSTDRWICMYVCVCGLYVRCAWADV